MSVDVSRTEVSDKGGIHLLDAVFHRQVCCVLELWHQEPVGEYLFLKRGKVATAGKSQKFQN